MTDFPVQVDDFWGDTGTVGIHIARNSLTEESSPVVQVLAFGSPHDLDSLEFTPEQARTFAVAIIAAADHQDPDGARPFRVLDRDEDVWQRTGDDRYEWAGGAMRLTLAELTADYGPLSEARL